MARWVSRVKGLLQGSVLEDPAVAFYHAVTKPGANPDNANLTAYRVMRRVIGRFDTCIDVGAHRGVFLRRMRQLSPGGRHLALEPLPELARVLRRDFPGVQVLEVAASDRAGHARFHRVVRLPGFSGLQRHPAIPEQDEVQEFDVVTAPLDTLITPAQGRIRFIKVDVEGAEFGVFRGAEQTLRAHSPVLLFEHDVRASRPHEASSEALFDFLTLLGYQIRTYTGFLARAPCLTASEFAVFSREGRARNFVASLAGEPQRPRWFR